MKLKTAVLKIFIDGGAEDIPKIEALLDLKTKKELEDLHALLTVLVGLSYAAGKSAGKDLHDNNK